MEIYTIGHTNHSQEEFISLVRHYNINCIVDVRSTPFSKFTPQFNKDRIKNALSKNGITYVYMGEEFGARRTNDGLYNGEGYLDFEKVRKDKEFLKGIERIKEGCKKKFIISLMCTEKDAFDCHRGILVAKGLKDNGFTVKHICIDNTIQTQDELEERLLDKYFPNRAQLNFLGNSTKNEDIEEAYRLRNRDIGFRRGRDESD